MDSVTAATLKVVIDAQAWLFAEQQRAKSAQMGVPMTQEDFEGYEDAFKQETAALIKELLEANNEV